MKGLIVSSLVFLIFAFIFVSCSTQPEKMPNQPNVSPAIPAIPDTTIKVTTTQPPLTHQNPILLQDKFVLQYYLEEEVDSSEWPSERFPLLRGCVYLSESLYIAEFEPIEVVLDATCPLSIGVGDNPDDTLQYLMVPSLQHPEQNPNDIIEWEFIRDKLPEAKTEFQRKGELWSSTLRLVPFPSMYYQILVVNTSNRPQEVGLTVLLIKEESGIQPDTTPSIPRSETPIEQPILSDLMPKSSVNLIAFVSDMDDDNGEIYTMDAQGLKQTRLTNDDLVDFLPSWSPDASKIAFISMIDLKRSICVMDSNGNNRTVLASGSNDSDELYPVWSPDGRSVLFNSCIDGDYEIYRVILDDGTIHQLTSNVVSSDVHPSWSPDGSEIAFASNREGTVQIYLMQPDGTGQRKITDSSGQKIAPAWSPDGEEILFYEITDLQSGIRTIYTIHPDGTGLTQLTKEGLVIYQPRWSPDSSKIAFVSKLDSKAFLFVMNSDGSNLVRLASIDTMYNQSPFSWSPDNERIAFSTYEPKYYNIYIIDIDASNLKNITASSANDFCPEWSP